MPNAPLIIREDITDNLIAALTMGKLDAAILATETDSNLLESIVLYDEPFWLAAPSSHPLAKKKEVAPSDIDPKSLLLLADGHCLRDQAIDLCSHPDLGGGAGADIRAVSLETLLQLAAAGQGITLAPELAVTGARGLAKGLVARPISGRSAHRRVRLAFRRNAPRMKAIAALAELVRDVSPIAR